MLGQTNGAIGWGLDIDGPGWRLFVVFVGTPPAPELVDRLMALRSGIDEFEVRGREIYWLVRGLFSDSKLSGALERTLGMPATVRGAPTVRKIASKYE